MNHFSICVDLTALAQALDSEQAHTSFGKLPLSTEKTVAQFSFPQGKREDQAKCFIPDLTKQENMGKLGPASMAYTDNIKYKEVSKIGVFSAEIQNARSVESISPHLGL